MSELHYHVTLRLFRDEKGFGPGPMRLLRGIERTGSLQQSAEQMGMAYSKAWKMLRALEAEWGFAMTEKHAGGAGGGGSSLTPACLDLLSRYERMLAAVERQAALSFEEHFSDL